MTDKSETPVDFNSLESRILHHNPEAAPQPKTRQVKRAELRTAAWEEVKADGGRARKQDGGRKKLSKVAPFILAAIRQNPPEWWPEFSEWASKTFGPKPSPITRRQASNEWDAAILGAVLAWGYFDAMLKENEQNGTLEPEETPAEPEPSAEPAEPSAIVVPRRQYAVLDAAGQPVIEGVVKPEKEPEDPVPGVTW